MGTTKWSSSRGFKKWMGVSGVVLPAVILGGLGMGDMPSKAAPLVLGSGSAPVPLRRLPTSENIRGQTLVDLKLRMGRHGKTMSNLVQAVVLLDRPTIRTLAGNIANEEIVARVSEGVQDGKGRKHLVLPREFYEEQDALRAAAQKLAAAALPGGDSKTMADAFGTVTKTCVACHDVYLYGKVPLSPPAEAPNLGPARKE